MSGTHIKRERPFGRVSGGGARTCWRRLVVQVGGRECPSITLGVAL